MSEPIIFPLAEVSSEAAAQLLALCMGDAFGREKSTALWEWKHHANPMGPSLGLAAFSPEGELIALRPFMRWQLRSHGGKQVMAVRAVDTAVHPAWRRSGLFSRLTRLALDELESKGIDLVFNTPNDRSGPGYRKMGWRLLGHPTLWVRPRIGSVLFSASVRRSLKVEELEPFLEQGEQLASRAVPSTFFEGLTVLKDAAFLKWRYAQHPNLSYAVVNAQGATAIVREDWRAGRRGVALVDYFFGSGAVKDFRSLLKFVRAQMGGSYLILGPLPRGPLRRAAMSQGFLPIPWRNVNLAARPVNWPQEAVVFQDRAAWSLTLGDLETF